MATNEHTLCRCGCNQYVKTRGRQWALGHATRQHFLPMPARFWAKVHKTETCWIWTGTTTPRGYGQIQVRGKRVLTHRLSYELAYGLILPGLYVCHHCDTPSCCRPDHLWLGTPRDNACDMLRKGRHVSHIRIGNEHIYRRRQPNPVRARAILTTEKVQEIRQLARDNTVSVEAISRMFGVHQATIRDILKRRTWRHV